MRTFTARWRSHRDSIRQDREMAKAVFGATPAQRHELDLIAQLSRRPV